MARRTRWAAVVTIILAAALAVVVACGKKDESNNGGHKGGGNQPMYYDETMHGWGFGTSLYKYSGGQWKRAEEQPFDVTIHGVVFMNAQFGYAYGASRIYRWADNNWLNVTPPDMPAATVIDASFNDQGGCWFAANDPSGAGYGIYIGPDGAPGIMPLTGYFSPNTVHILALFAIPGEISVHMLLLMDGYFQHVVWDGTNTIKEPILQLQFEQPGDDDTTAQPDDDDSSPQPPQLMGAVLDLNVGPDGIIWAAGWDKADGEAKGVFWRREGNGAFTRFVADASSGCTTTAVNKLHRTPDNVGFALASCTHAQVYRQTSNSSWMELSTPGAKGAEYEISDMAMLSVSQGWMVGYTSEFDEPLFLLVNAEGFLQARFEEGNTGDRLYAAVMFPTTPGGVGGDDDTSPDDDVSPDDDTADDDTTDDDTPT